MRLNFKLSPENRGYMQRCAAIRRTSVTTLCERLIEMIAKDQLVLPILDDDSQPTKGRRYNYGSRSLYNPEN
jgi:hypothetical protein